MKRIISFLIFILSFFLLASCDLSSYVSDKTPNTPDTEKEEEIEIGDAPAQDDFSKMTNREMEAATEYKMNSGSLYDGMRYAKINPINGKIKLEIFLDVNSLEVFINDGYYTMTANIYAPKDADNVSLFVENSKAKFRKI